MRITPEKKLARGLLGKRTLLLLAIIFFHSLSILLIAFYDKALHPNFTKLTELRY
jgi:hypothetical protein